MNEKFNDVLFFKLWRNIVVNTVIFKYSRLYIKNQTKVFNNAKSLREYSEREFITNITYKEDDYIDSLLKGDLPEYGVLKGLNLTFCLSISNCNIIPQGVEIIHFNYRGLGQIQLSELPSSVHTITNVTLKKPYSNNQIPTNIKSISFFNIDSKEFYDLKLPNSILKLDLKCLERGIPNISSFQMLFSKKSTSTFIPSSVTDLTTFYDEKYKSKLPAIPASVTKLQLNVGGEGECNIKKGVIPIGVKDLFIEGAGKCDINILENSLPPSITKLYIHYGWSATNTFLNVNIKPSSIPNSVTDLTIRYNEYPLSFKGMFPSSLTSLDVSVQNYTNDDSPPYTPTIPPPTLISELPSSIKHLKINHHDLKNK